MTECVPLTLPEGEEDDGLDHEELEHGAVGAEQLAGGEEEEEEGVQRQADRDVVHDAHVQVAAGNTRGREAQRESERESERDKDRWTARERVNNIKYRVNDGL